MVTCLIFITLMYGIFKNFLRTKVLLFNVFTVQPMKTTVQQVPLI